MGDSVERDVSGQHDVFISYSRKDIAFVRILHGMLAERGLGTWVDWQDIPPSADWMAEVYKAIESANAFIFVMSDTSTGSDVCRLELDHAIKNNKRLIPITVHDVEPAVLPPEVAARNWVFFREQDDIQESFNKLLEAVETDLEWTKAHTALLQRAIEWDERDREAGFLLHGAALADALSKVAEASTGREPALTQLQVDYVQESQAAQAAQELRWKRRTQVIRGVISGALVVSVALTVWALVNAAEARRQQQLSRSNELVAYSREMVQTDPLVGYLLARAALDVKPTPAAQAALWDPLQYPFTRATMTGHSQSVSDVELSPDGKFAVTSAGDGTARVFDTTTGEQLRVLESEDGHKVKLINDAEFADGGRLVVTMTAFANVTGGSLACVWDVATGELVTTLVHNDFSFGAPLISPDQTLIVTCGAGEFGDWGNKLVVYDAATGNELRTLDDLTDLPHSAVFSPDGTRVAAGCLDGSVVIWDVATGGVLRRLEGHSESVYGVAFSPDGAQIATASSDATLRLWDSATGQQLGSTDCGNTLGLVLFSPSGERVAVKRDPDEVVVVDAQTWSQVYVLKKSLESGSSLWESEDVAFSPDGALLLSAAPDGSAQVNDSLLGGLVLSLRGHASTVTSVAFSADGKQAITGSEDETARMWDLVAGQAIVSIKPAPNPPYVSSLETGMLSSDGARIVVLLADGTGAVYTADTGEQEYALTEDSGRITFAGFSPDGALLATFSEDGPPTLWDAATGEKARELSTSSDRSMSNCQFSPDGKYLLAAEGKNGEWSVHVWEVASGEETQVIPFGSADLGSATFIRDIDLSADGVYLAVAFQKETTVWDVGTGKKVAALVHESEPEWVRFSPDGRVLFDGVSYPKAVTVAWDWSAEERLYTLEGAKLLDFSPNGMQMVTKDDDDAVRIRDVVTDTIVTTMSWPVAPVAATFSPDGTRMAVGYVGGEVRIWDVASARTMHVFVGHLESAQPLGFTPDGSRLVTLAWRDSVRVWPATYHEMLKLMDEGFRGDVRDLQPAERAEYGFTTEGE
ncbi:MAG: TIR domain-containing protein [Coriobacteriia bacterium]|nr:TIR domain-containing protein [Coriobacteriia bacterium]